MPADRSESVLDASALLAYLEDERGVDVIAAAIATGAAISSVNLAEMLSTLASRGVEPSEVSTELADRGLLGGAISVEPFTYADAVETARLRPMTRSVGLSLGDRACLALGRRLSAPVLTADQAWAALDVGIVVSFIREPGP